MGVFLPKKFNSQRKPKSKNLAYDSPEYMAMIARDVSLRRRIRNFIKSKLAQQKRTGDKKS